MSPHINHVSVNATDLGESTRFYEELLGAQRIATPNFGGPVQWLALGDTQLHLFQRDLAPTSHHHLGITVEDLEPVYRGAERWDAFEDEAFHSRLVLLPDGVVQLYVRDPAGNLVELDQADGADGLAPDMRGRLRVLADLHPQGEDNLRGRLYLDGA